MHSEGESLRKIAEFISRNPSTISRELKRNRAPMRQVFNNPYSRAAYAEELANKRKHQSKVKRRLKNDTICTYVIKHLKEKRSPRDISIRLSVDYPEYSISHEAIYQWIYNERRDLIKYLPRKGKRRNRANPRKRYLKPAANKVNISKRPEIVLTRQRFGDWEGDTIVSRQSKACIFTLVERKSRFTILHKLDACDSRSALSALLESFYQIPPELRLTLTLDNGSENACHDKLAMKTALRVYFCDAYASWQRGTVENTNGFIRWFFPKKTDFANVTDHKLRYVQDWLNTRRMDCLNGETPAQVFLQRLQRYPNQIYTLFPHLGNINQSFRLAA